MTAPRPTNPFALAPRPHGVERWMPGITTLRTYRAEWLGRDILAGMVLAAILLPAGMGYSQAAGLLPIYGLYATIPALLAYAVFGPSRILVLGPDSSLAALIAATVLPLAAGDAPRAAALAGMLAILSGGLCLAAGLARFGFITELISKPIRFGYLNGIALTVLVGQLPQLLGFPVSGHSLPQELTGLVRGLLAHAINPTATALGLSCLAIIYVLRRLTPGIPGILPAIVAATLATAIFDLAPRAGLAVVGVLPQGVPAFQIPAVSLDQVQAMLAGAAAIALVSLADMSALSRTFAARAGREVDDNQELLALGAANIACGLFQGFPVGSSASRTPVAEAAGARTQLTGLVGAACIALLLAVAPATVRNVPLAALSAVVIAATLGLIEVRGVARLYQLRRGEFALSILCFLGVVLLGVIPGMFIAVSTALLAFIWRAWRPYDAVLGRVDGMKGYHDITRHPEARRIPGLVLFRWDAPLFFANAGIFRDHVRRAVAEAPTPTKWVVVAAEPVTDIDVTAADVLADLDRDLHAAGMDLCFAEMKGPVKDRLKRYGLFTRLGTENFFPTIGQAVDRYVAAHRVEWRDWED